MLVVKGGEKLPKAESLKTPSFGLNYILGGGLWSGRYHIIWGNPQAGKALASWEKVLTPTGWEEISDLVVGDYVIGSDGNPTRVLGVFPQGFRDLYTVTFSDGAKVVCDEEHLWTFRTSEDVHGGKTWWRTDSLKNIVGYQKRSNGVQVETDWCHIPIAEPAKTFLADLPIDPYTLGVLLGNGSFRTGSIRFSTDDDFILKNLDTKDLRVTKVSDFDYRISAERGRDNWLLTELESLDLWSVHGLDKSIPAEYMFSDPDDRLEMLRGLMDTDGYVDKGGRCEFSSSSPQLITDVVELVRSLGGVTGNTGAGIRMKKTTNADHYRVTVTLPVNPFRLPRKADRWSAKPVGRTIRSIDYYGRGHATCIRVEAEDGLFVANDYVVTHNTTLAFHAAAEAQKLGYTTVVIDAEGSATDEWMVQCGIDIDDRIVIRSTILEDILNVIMPMFREKDSKYFFVFDSINTIVMEQFYKNDDGMGGIGIYARSQGVLIQKIADQLISGVNHVVVFIAQQTIAAKGQFFVTQGKYGNAAYHWATNIIRLHAGDASADVDRDDDERITSRKVTWRIDKSKQRSIQGTKGDYWFSPESATIDLKREAFHIAVRNGIITKKGAWFEWDGKSYHGADKLISALSEGDMSNILSQLEQAELSFDSDAEGSE